MRLLILCLFLLFSSSSSTAHAQESSPHFSADAQLALGAYRGIVEQHIAGIRHTLRVIAESAEAKSGAWDQCGPLLKKLSDDLTTDATAWFVLPDGSYTATEGDGEAEKNLKDRHYFPALMSGREVFGDLARIFHEARCARREK